MKKKEGVELHLFLFPRGFLEQARELWKCIPEETIFPLCAHLFKLKEAQDERPGPFLPPHSD